jgi:hypothetical protein
VTSSASDWVNHQHCSADRGTHPLTTFTPSRPPTRPPDILPISLLSLLGVLQRTRHGSPWPRFRPSSSSSSSSSSSGGRRRLQNPRAQSRAMQPERTASPPPRSTRRPSCLTPRPLNPRSLSRPRQRSRMRPRRQRRNLLKTTSHAGAGFASTTRQKTTRQVPSGDPHVLVSLSRTRDAYWTG